ncbi:TMEM248 [Bugula neritina]|uniref:TMEM248 n=1 Tax=Bugula neritina TaxID=10212 RepID=A0A7J7JJW5_BUGNE|nr:TMEM248 [Bugula neritina]
MKHKNGHWTGLTPCENLRSCCISRPPLVLFTFGLLILTAAFVFLAQYVKDTQLIPDPNYDTDWETFLTDLSDKSWSSDSQCLTNPKNLPKNDGNLTKAVSVLVYLDNASNLKYRQSYEAVLWKELLLPREKLDKEKLVSVIEFTRSYSHPGGPVSNSSASSGQDGSDVVPVCMTIKSNDTFLSPKLKSPNACKPTAPETTQSIYLCDKPSPKSPLFSVVYEARDQPFKMYLTEEDKLNIHIHLMSTSYFLIMLAATVLLYGLIKRRAQPLGSESPPLSQTSEV